MAFAFTSILHRRPTTLLLRQRNVCSSYKTRRRTYGTTSMILLHSSSNNNNKNVEFDNEGRVIRKRGSEEDYSSSSSFQNDHDWDHFDPWDDHDQQEKSLKRQQQKPKRQDRKRGNEKWNDNNDYSSSAASSSSWNNDDDDDDGFVERRFQQDDNDDDDYDDYNRRRSTTRQRSSEGRDRRGSGGDRRRHRDSYQEDYSTTRRRRRNDDWNSYNNDGSYYSDNNNNHHHRRGRYRNERQRQSSPPEEKKINMKALEGAGFVHLYGLAPVLNALQAQRRNFHRPEDDIDLDALTPEQRFHEEQQRQRKPEAQYSPWLFIQKRKDEQQRHRRRSLDKIKAATKIEQLAQECGLPIAYLDKGVLNTLCGNRPHQGYVLRCGHLDFEPLHQLPNPSDDQEHAVPSIWLVLDEIVDPQNLGALLRSAHFLGNNKKRVGILVCSKNSSPLTPIVSAASAGSLELTTIYSTTNLPKTLELAKKDGYRIIGATMDIASSSNNKPIYNLQDLPPETYNRPILLVLGNEGYGLRKLVLNSCTEYVRINNNSVESSSFDNEEHNNNNEDDHGGGVDSLNVSVTGGILLWHLLHNN